MTDVYGVSDEFHKRILCPDVSQSELVILHTLAKQLYINYIAPDAHDKIKFEKDVVAEIRDGQFLCFLVIPFSQLWNFIMLCSYMCVFVYFTDNSLSF